MKKGSKMTLKQRRKVSESHKGIKYPNRKRAVVSEETKAKKRKIWQEHRKNPEFMKELKDKIRTSLAEPKSRKRRIEKIKKKYAEPEFKKRLSKQRKGKHHSPKTEFKKGLEPWNKNKVGVMPEPWNKGRTDLPPAWNKGVVGVIHHAPEARLKIKKARAKQVFPVKDSKPEKKIQDYLRKINLEFIAHKFMKIEHAYCCDLFIPSKNLIIEVDGDYWHGNINNPKHKTLNKNQIEQTKEDKIRTKELKDKGYNVKRLWESDINKMKLDDFRRIVEKF